MFVKTRNIITLLAVLFMAWSCEEDEITISSEPQLGIETSIMGLPGETIVFTGLVSDVAGISSIDIVYEAWDLAKTIEIDSRTTQYDLSYAFKIPEDQEVGSTHNIAITATNAGGNMTGTQVQVVLSGDNESPVISLASPNDGGTYIVGGGPEFNLTFSVDDNEQIQNVSIVGFGINESIDVNAATYSFDQGIDFSLAGSFPLTISAVDVAGNTSSTSITVSIEESLRFEKLYLADVNSDAELVSDLFGVPMVVNSFDHPDSAGVIFEALYYNTSPNTPIRFIPQKSSFAPFTFGAGENDGELALGNDASISPIILPEVAYYRIIVNFVSLTYTMETYTPTDDAFEQIIVMGTGVNVDGNSTCINNADGSDGACWWFGSGKNLTKDPNNPYRFTGTVDLYDYDTEGDGNNGFILGANPENWSPFWRFDVGEAVGLEPERTVPNGGSNFLFGPEDYGSYTFEFDTHLNRVKVIPQ
ncbi:MAG: hypothetical protein AAFO07_04395 [Bacteroidota bacterium]